MQQFFPNEKEKKSLKRDFYFVDFEGLPFHFPDRYTCDMSPFAGQWIMPGGKQTDERKQASADSCQTEVLLNTTALGAGIC